MTDYYSLIPNFKKEIADFLNKSKSLVILEVDNNSQSIGYKIFESLKNDFIIFPVSKEQTILNKNCYSSLSKINENIDAAIITTESKDTLAACQECFNNKILNIWIEIGSESKEALDFCKEKNINLIYLHSIIREKINPSSAYESKKES